MTDHAEIKKLAEEAATEYVVHLCPICGRQYPGPRGHRVLGDDHATSCFHEEATQPKLEKIRVVSSQAYADLSVRLEKLQVENVRLLETLRKARPLIEDEWRDTSESSEGNVVIAEIDAALNPAEAGEE